MIRVLDEITENYVQTKIEQSQASVFFFNKIVAIRYLSWVVTGPKRSRLL